ncbi:hypothetical protein [Candidatus Entotheonella palauensis]|uniref:hypothetical protein n=1 Tax=Candidatus Entotheonella palauensis TaxID=93172 RepID=UPI000B7E6AA4|nr:hypothetical protein [Candidatus Entotheonella palauensis]
MTKRERLSVALRRLRNLKEQGDAALRIHRTHELTKEMIDELSKGTKNADVGQHTTQLLDDLYALSTGALEDGQLPAPPVMPDCTEQIQAQTQALQAITAEDDPTRQSEMADVLRRTLSLFALGPNAAPIEGFLNALDNQIKQANDRPPALPDCAEAIEVQTQALSNLEGIDDPDHVCESAVSILRNTLSVFAQGPNAAPIAAFLDTFNDRLQAAKPQPAPIPDHTEAIEVQTGTLSNLEGTDNAQQMLEVAVNALSHALSVLAQGPNEPPVQTLLSQVQQTLERTKTLPTPLPDYSSILQPHVDTLEALVDKDDLEAAGEAGTTILCHVLSTFAQGSNEAPIERVLAAVERLNQQQAIDPVSLGSPPLASHIEALTALEGLDDPDALTAAAAMTLYEALTEMATGPHEAAIRALLDRFDQVTGAV